MREIKFRVWNQELNEMYEIKKMNYFGSVGIVDNLACGETAIWLAYTGLKDANGIEIFEGDILRVWVTKTINFVAMVDCLNGAFGIGSIPSGYGYHYRFSSFHNNVGTRYEVIGNIYENKNLLEEK